MIFSGMALSTAAGRLDCRDVDFFIGIIACQRALDLRSGTSTRWQAF
jgi:hypothetical protein